MKSSWFASLLPSIFMVIVLWSPHAQGNFQLTILHTNDVHGRVMPIDGLDQTCGPEQRKRCYGGAARRMSKIKEIRTATPNVVLLDAGDQFQGTLFYTRFKGNESRIMMNMMGYDAMALGNHEFDDGPKNLARFIKSVRFPVLSANVDASNDDDLRDLVNHY